MATSDLSCLYTTIKNTSGGALPVVGFLPPHGGSMDADEEVTVLGNLTEAVMRGDRFGNRHLNALLAALEDGTITIKSTPTPVLYDSENDFSKILVLHDGTLHLLDPCWEVSSSL